MIVVYTVITGEYDRLRPPGVVEPGVRYIAFSDRPRRVEGWECQPFPQCFGRDARNNSRVPKMLPHLLLDCDHSIYHDGAFRLRANPSELVADWLRGYDVAMVRHPMNTSLMGESGWDGKSEPQNANQAQAKAIYERGLAPDGCWAAGLIVRRHNEATARMGETWMREYLAGTTNDQISIFPAIALSGVTVATINRNILNCPEASYHLHADSGCQDNVEYEAERDRWRARVARIWEVCGQ